MIHFDFQGKRPSEAVRGRQRPSEAVRGHQMPLEAIRGRQRLSDVVRGNFLMLRYPCIIYVFGKLIACLELISLNFLGSEFI